MLKPAALCILMAAATAVGFGAASDAHAQIRTFTVDPARSGANVQWLVNGFRAEDAFPVTGSVSVSWPASGAGVATLHDIAINVPNITLTAWRLGVGTIPVSLTGFGIRGFGTVSTTCGLDGDGRVSWSPFVAPSSAVGIAGYEAPVFNTCSRFTNVGMPCLGALDASAPGPGTGSGAVERVLITKLGASAEQIEFAVIYTSPLVFGGSTVGAITVGTTLRGTWSPPACAVDFDGSGGPNIDDIFTFLNAWFLRDPRTNFDGQGGITIDDIFIYLNAWFGGC